MKAKKAEKWVLMMSPHLLLKIYCIYFQGNKNIIDRHKTNLKICQQKQADSWCLETS